MSSGVGQRITSSYYLSITPRPIPDSPPFTRIGCIRIMWFQHKGLTLPSLELWGQGLNFSEGKEEVGVDGSVSVPKTRRWDKEQPHGLKPAPVYSEGLLHTGQQAGTEIQKFSPTPADWSLPRQTQEEPKASALEDVSTGSPRINLEILESFAAGWKERLRRMLSPKTNIFLSINGTEWSSGKAA